MQHTIETPKQYQCRHIFTDGRRCSSPCLRQEEFCYYHHTTRKPIANPKQRRSRRSTFHLPLPEDRSAIQSSIGEVLQRIAANDIDPRRAGLLLYGLQIASLNLPKTPPATKLSTQPQTSNQTVEEITIHPTLGILAPRAEVAEITKRKSPVAELLEKMMLSDAAETAALTGQPGPATIPTLQATADKAAGSDPHDRTGDPHLTPPQKWVPHLRDGLIVAKVGIRAKAQTFVTTPNVSSHLANQSHPIAAISLYAVEIERTRLGSEARIHSVRRTNIK